MELRSTETAQVDAQSDEWFASYAEPSNQPRTDTATSGTIADGIRGANGFPG